MTIPGTDPNVPNTPPADTEPPVPPPPPADPPPADPPADPPKTVPLETLLEERKKRQEQEAAAVEAKAAAAKAAEELRLLKEANMSEAEKAEAARLRLLEEQETLKANAAKAATLEEKLAALEARDKEREESVSVLLESQIAGLTDAQAAVIKGIPGGAEKQIATLASMRAAGMIPPVAGYSDSTRIGSGNTPSTQNKNTLQAAREGFRKGLQKAQAAKR